MAYVTGRHQPVDLLLGLATGVALKAESVANEDSPRNADLGDRPVAIVKETHDRPPRRSACGAGSGAQIDGAGDRRPSNLG